MVRNSDYALEVQDIRKAFYGNQVLKGISFGIQKGEVLGLLGSNGAGKSTLMKIINGVYTLDQGKIRINGEDASIRSAEDAQKLGIAMVYQEFSLIPTLTVAQNMFLKVEPKKGFLIRDGEARRRTKAALAEFGIDIDPNAELGTLSVGNQQLVEIVKALQKKPSVLILDEPTASLTTKEVELLFSFIRRLKKEGISIFFISHHMQEIMQICDRAVVLRDGLVELNEPTGNLTVEHMVHAMVGKSVSTDYLSPKNETTDGQELLRISGLSYRNKVKDVSLSVSGGEIVGLAGLMGSGRTELLESVFGTRKYDRGSVQMTGKAVTAGKPWAAIAQGLFLVPENRHRSGIVGIHSIYSNMMMAVWKKQRGKAFLLNDKKARTQCEAMRRNLDVASVNIDQELIRLSGGNQQKVVFAKSLLTEPKVLLLDEPTTGIDVEAKAGIAQLIRNLADNGSGVLIASSETEELVRVCDRVLIMNNGRIIE
ncbi:MAG: sugar ABC transporter ATP-binding protein, partial [Bacillota bacterium]